MVEDEDCCICGEGADIKCDGCEDPVCKGCIKDYQEDTLCEDCYYGRQVEEFPK